MSRMGLMLLALAASGIALAGCAAKEAKWTKDAAQYAVYAQKIPLYPGTKIVDSMGSESWGDAADSYSYGMTWWCKAKASKDQLLAWYESRLPDADRRDTDYGVELTVTPEGASANEDMGVLVVGDGEYRVFEHTKQKKQGV
jgi:hypothetical protein